MAVVVEAIYENGVLKLNEPLPLKEHEKVQVIVQSSSSPLLDSYGIMGFTGSAEEADYYALDPELDYPPAPERGKLTAIPLGEQDGYNPR